MTNPFTGNRRRATAIALIAAVGVIVGLGSWSGDQRAAHAEQSDPASVLLRHFSAANRGDAAAAATDFAPGAIVVGGLTCFPTPCASATAIQHEIETAVSQHIYFTIVSQRVDGSAVQGRLEVTADAVRGAGVNRIVILYTMVVADDHIVMFGALPDPTDAETAKFLAAAQS
jgi:hypothetical protein